MPFNNRDEEEEDTTFDEVSQMADRLGLKGKQRSTYIDDHMSQLGYQAVQSRESYVRPTRDDDEGQGAGRWGFGRGAGGGAGGQAGRGRQRPPNDDDTY